MPSTYTDRIDGLSTSVAVKAPVRVATTTNITLSGLQTVNSVVLVADDRILVKDQTDATENGIYDVSTSTWERARDFDGNRDVVTGTLIWDLTASIFYQVTTTGTITIGTSSITFGIASSLSISGLTEVATIAVMTALPKSSLVADQQVSVGGYTTAGDDGGGPLVWKSSSTTAENLVTIWEADEGGTGRWERSFNGDVLLTPAMAGAPSGGVSDATTEIAAMLLAGDSIIDGLYAVTGVTTTNYLTMMPDARLVYIGSQNGTCLTLGADFGDIYIDGDLEDCVGATFDTDGVTGKSIYVERVTASATSSTAIYPIRFNADNCQLGSARTFNTQNTGQANGSFPQAVGIVGTSDNTSITEVYCEDGASALTFGGSSGKSFIKRIRSKNMTDNGVYGLGGDNYVDEFIYEGTEEAYVCSGSASNHTIGSITTIGLCIGALELGAANNVKVDTIYMTDNGTGKTCVKAVLTRSTATTVNNLWIGTIKGHIQDGNGIINMDSAVTEYLQIDKIDLVLDFDSTSMPTKNAWFDLTGVEQYNIGPATIRIRDVDDSIVAPVAFVAKFPAPLRESVVENFDVYLETSTGAVHADATYESTTPKEFLTFRGSSFTTSGKSREANFQSGDRDTISNAPSGGYWRAGRQLKHNDIATASPFAFACTVTGTPGTWISLNAP